MLKALPNTVFYVYLHCKPDGTPFYVGKGTWERAHSLTPSKRNKKHVDSATKYGRKNIKIYAFECESEDQAFKDEIQLTKQMISEGFDLAVFCLGGGGTSGWRHADETKLRIGNASKGNKYALGKKASEETKKKLSLASRGRVLGPQSEATKAKISASKSGVKQSPEAIANRVASLSKSWESQEVREKRAKNCAIANTKPEVMKRRSEGAKRFWANRKAGTQNSITY